VKTWSAKIGLRPAWLLFVLLTVSYLQIIPSIVLAATSFNVTNLTVGNSVTADTRDSRQRPGSDTTIRSRQSLAMDSVLQARWCS